MTVAPPPAPSPRRRRRLLGCLLTPILALAVLEGGLWIAAIVLRPDVRLEMGQGERTILCVGDSNTFGVHLERDESYPGQLQALLERWPENPWRVVNAGYPGLNSAQIRWQLARNLETYRPEIVICWIGVNNTWSTSMRHLWDMPDTEVRASAGERFVQRLRVLKLARMLINRMHSSAADEGERAKEDEVAQDEGKGKVVAPERVRETLRIDLRRIRALCDAAGARLVMADYPVHIDYTERVVNGPLREIAAESGTPLVPLHDTILPVVYGLGYDRTMFSDYHANRRGNHEVARRVLLALMDAGLLERRPEWTSVPPLWETVPDWPLRAIDTSRAGATVLLHGPAGASYALRLSRVYATSSDKTQRIDVPDPGFDALSPGERAARGFEGRLDAAGDARVALALPPEPPPLEIEGARATWLGWRLAVRYALEGAPPKKRDPEPVDVLLDPAVIGAVSRE